MSDNTPSNLGMFISTGASITARQLALERELNQLVSVNDTIAKLINSIQFTQNNVQRMNSSSNNTHDLLDQWIRILSQTNFTHEIINDTRWDGTSKQEEGEKEEADKKDRDEATEQKLLAELDTVESENRKLLVQINEKSNERELDESKSSESSNKRKRELGLEKEKPRVRSKTQK